MVQLGRWTDEPDIFGAAVKSFRDAVEHALEREGRVALEALIDFLRDMRMEVLRGTAVIHLGACRSIVRASATLVVCALRAELCRGVGDAGFEMNDAVCPLLKLIGLCSMVLADITGDDGLDFPDFLLDLGVYDYDALGEAVRYVVHDETIEDWLTDDTQEIILALMVASAFVPHA